VIKALDEKNNYVDIWEASPDKQFYCPFCKQPLLQRRGDIREHCFAHYPEKSERIYGYRKCTETWHYDKTQWHIDWQRKFPKECYEVIVEYNGKRHIADVLINNTVIEFQHSPISAEEFRDRNEFYSKCGYEVIWLFDLSEEYDSEAICFTLSKYGEQYNWERVKSPFKDIVVKNEKATIYVQFSNNSNEFCIERITYSGNNFRYFTTNKKVYTPQSFALEALTNTNKLVAIKKEEITDFKPYEEKGGKTIDELWNSTYAFVVVNNLATNEDMMIFGNKGDIGKSYTREHPDGLIIGKYSTAKSDGSYKYSDFYIVKNADKPIWKVKYFRKRDLEKEAEEERAKIEAQEKFIKQQRVERERILRENIERAAEAARIEQERKHQEYLEARKIKEAEEIEQIPKRKSLYLEGQLDEETIIAALSKRKCPICGTQLYIQGNSARCGFNACGYTVKQEHKKHVRGLKII